MINSLTIRETRNEIVAFLNTKPYPNEIKRLIIQDIYSELDKLCADEIARLSQLKDDEMLKENTNE